MNPENLVGILASVLIAVYLVPQLVKLIREKDAGSISLLMFAILIAGQGLWVWYGFLKNDWIIIISNCFSASINLFIIGLSIKYKQKNPSASKQL